VKHAFSIAACCLSAALSFAACGDDDTGSGQPATPDAAAPALHDAAVEPHADAAPAHDASSPAQEPTSGPVADLSEEIADASAAFIAAASGLSVPDGYVAHEFVAAGTASSYEADGALADDGRWRFVPDARAAYRTRVLVLRPEAAAKASGTVVVEWLNVSGGADANPEYAMLAEEIARQGHTWVGVSAQRIGVEGGAVLVSVPDASGVAGKGLKAIDPERYGSLTHPGDGFAFDIYTQIARALRQGGAPLAGAEPERLIAAGESQSAFALTTYYDGVQPLTEAFDGFFVHSRGASSLPLVAAGASADLAGSLGGTHPILRDDLGAPVLELQSEGDLTGLLDSSASRQPDSDHFRLWEVAGTAHADTRLVGERASTLDCGVPINNGPMHVVAKAALRSLDDWLRSGTAPPTAERIELTRDASPKVARDADGIALGGIRTPPVDVPVDVLSGDPGPKSDIICLLLGSTTPLSDARLAELYVSRADYVRKYSEATDLTITSGFALEDDRDALQAFAQPERFP
jgi:hypothetical protein